MRLIGIAKAAAEAPTLEAKREVTYRRLATGKWITKVDNPRHSFSWSINPYRGCEMACRYCYARYTHEFMELNGGEDFETKIFAKTWSAPAFHAELARVPMSQSIAIGTATDPYQHAERRYQLTRKILEVFAGQSARKLSITTKSDLPVRDIEVLGRVAQRNQLHLNFTITTLDLALARELEPGAPRPDLRLEAIERLSARGIHCGVIASPVIPGLNDSETGLEALAAAAKAKGGKWFAGGMLFLKSPTREVFFDYVREQRPALLRPLMAVYKESARPAPACQSALDARFEAIRQRQKLARRAPPYLPPDWEAGQQLSLAL
jgi:DNA repair photolyase